ncbi:Holliday junction resolvase RuvX [Candidatus Uhrbacteria bacterium CG10_big_fil_rev_8_21_14_0_10_50_16]|uniref:Putative pre-16S rRNA nuclease n=1 Tax=Candidatus Uhrbacteria bacterium CG10_big_fil_rev_8_21_14_0_10_50_16 TaxID=1975039 RepID=A0A2H0RM50_9BACT|nr:MAG: Holliday junction resolvase RuvX [Candidatus Uhrbacteria bacterium CG10_big_fil_rev_8_21_14_0_10_50_16]
MKRILGIDLGTKRLGFALGEPVTGMAVPLDVVELNGQDPVQLVADMVREDGYDFIVMGEARTADGEATPMSERAAAFAKELQDATGVTVALVNEHLTSRASDTLAEEAGRSRHDDALAAMLIVQEFLNERP